MAESQVSRPLRCYLSSRMFRSVALVALIAFNAVGCGDQQSQIDRKPIYGNIVGAEGRDGLVTFIPIDTSIGPAAIGSFEDGAYRFSKDEGPVPGKYDVYIEFEVSASAAVASRNRSGRRRISKNPADVGRVSYEPEKAAAAVLVSADGPFEIDLHLTESESQ